MRIILANYRYFISGGPERYMFNLTDALETQGHEVIPFSVRYKRNHSTPYTDYFVDPLGSDDQIYFRDQDRSLKSIYKTLSRLFYAKDVEQAVTQLIEDTKPQVAYVLHYLRKLSPALLVGLHRVGMPIVVRISDFVMLCPQTQFLREDTPCELCIKGNLFPSIKYRCVQKSLVASTMNYLATKYHKIMRHFDLVDRFVVTTRFMYQKMLEAGYAEERLCYIPTFVNDKIFHPEIKDMQKKYIAYAGRLVAIKGVHVLVDAFALLRARRPDIDISLRIAGQGDVDYLARLKEQVKHLNLEDSVVFLGEQNVDQIVELLNKAFLSVVPSLWYENLPNAILESYACGTPVLASNIGSLPECIDEGKTGYLFHPADAEDLARRLGYCYDHPEKIIEMGRYARRVAETTYSQERHLVKLKSVFLELTHEQSQQSLLGKVL